MMLAATAQGFLYELALRVVHQAPANMSATMKCADAELMLSIETVLASFSAPLTNINTDCSAKNPRTRLRNTFILPQHNYRRYSST
jgi:hypothetical protein